MMPDCSFEEATIAMVAASSAGEQLPYPDRGQQRALARTSRQHEPGRTRPLRLIKHGGNQVHLKWFWLKGFEFVESLGYQQESPTELPELF